MDHVHRFLGIGKYSQESRGINNNSVEEPQQQQQQREHSIVIDPITETYQQLTWDNRLRTVRRLVWIANEQDMHTLQRIHRVGVTVAQAAGESPVSVYTKHLPPRTTPYPDSRCIDWERHYYIPGECSDWWDTLTAEQQYNVKLAISELPDAYI